MNTRRCDEPMYVNKTIDEMLEELANPQLAAYFIQPAGTVAEAIQNLNKYSHFWGNRQNQVMKDVQEYLKKEQYHFIIEPVNELIGNACRHGNYDPTNRGMNGDPLKSLTAKIFEGENGIIIRIRNEGKGFDFKQTIRNFHEGRKYTNNFLGGNGTRMLNMRGLQVSYEDEGRTVNLLHKRFYRIRRIE